MTQETRALCAALLLLPGLANADSAVVLVEHAGESAAFRIEGKVQVLAIGDAVAGTRARVLHVNRDGVVLELPADAGGPGALLQLRRGEVLRLPPPPPKHVVQPQPVLDVRRMAAPSAKQDPNRP